MSVISARGLRKQFGKTVALDGIDLSVEAGSILGLIGSNGAGKSTTLYALLGLIQCEGQLRVLDRDPWSERDTLMRDVAFITDVAALPRWMRVSQILRLATGLHPRFRPASAESFLAKTAIGADNKIANLSKGMVTQLHLALVLGIDARLMVLDEPALGLDVPSRKQFYDHLLGDYCDGNRTVVITTHQIDEMQDLFTHVAFMREGKIIFQSGTDELESRYCEVLVSPEHATAARALRPIRERHALGRSLLLFEDVDRQQLANFGDLRTPHIAELFSALSDSPAEAAQETHLAGDLL